MALVRTEASCAAVQPLELELAGVALVGVLDVVGLEERMVVVTGLNPGAP